MMAEISHAGRAGNLIFRRAALAIGAAALAWSVGAAGAEESTEAADIPATFMNLLIGDGAERVAAARFIDENWESSFLPMALETLYIGRDPRLSAFLLREVEKQTGESFGFDVQEWWKWQWNLPADQHENYATFKSRLYSLVDPKFAGYFADDRTAKIRLDEVVWGGVRQDGIPPLRNPVMIDGADADYLEDDNVIFGLSVNGDARAYPKRILAWHEMFVDDVGGLPVAGVYCTLCGTMILYNTEVDGTVHKMGTSGFLYRSNKLMYDQDTQSLWNTIWGRPVIGPLADEDIELERMSVVTTTWGEWLERHPETKVLSLETGYHRDYSEGAAYRAYFATDELMFDVPTLDTRLANKAEVLGLVFSRQDAEPLAISADYLAANPVHHDAVGTQELVVFTDPSGANRVYETGGRTFASYDGGDEVTDNQGGVWMLGEAELTANDGTTLARLPAHRAFWFGWYSAYGDTRLVY